jgi:hypothetical protein
MRRRTRDVEVEDVIFLDHVVYELFAILVDYEDLPLPDVLAMRVRGAKAAYVAAGGGADGTEDYCTPLEAHQE